MNRRMFLGTIVAPSFGPAHLALEGGAPAAPLAAQKGPPRAEPVENQTPLPHPTIALNHLDFRPGVGRKILVVRATESPAPGEFTLRDVGSESFHFTRPLTRVTGDLGPCLIADFTDLDRPGMYQITVGGEHSVPFFIREDTWRRTLPKAVAYYRSQRCGVEVPGVHPACHLDDARRRDTGEHVDVVGGRHDAGDLRKWMDPTLLNGIALVNLLRAIPEPKPGDPTREQVLEEVRHGNIYFLKMQDADGRVWHDAAGGVKGDNSDNHWTDNRVGTADDRYIDTRKDEHISAMFAALEALAAQSYRASDPAYASRCLEAGERAWRGLQRRGATLDVAWWTMAACELFRATAKPDYRQEALALGQILLASQYTRFEANQRAVRGFWNERTIDPRGTISESSMGVNPYFNVVYPALPALALLELYETFPDAEGRARWKEAVALHLDEFVLPMAGHNAFEIIPSGLFVGQPTSETYRPLAGELTYRYFMPVRKQFWWLGINSHLSCYALLLARYAGMAGGGGKRYAELAYRQLEWIMGANPFGACMMTAEGMRNPYPHSRFVGLIPGGIMNGIAGNAEDEPILDQAYDLDWRTCEYWSPHVAFYIWAVSELEKVKRI